MSYANFGFDVHEHVARITIDRPKAYNAIDLATAREFFDIANRCSTDRSVRAVVLTGSGSKAFCAGGDVGAFAREADTVDRLIKDITGYLHTAISRLAWMDAPVIAAVNGVAAGAGIGLVAAADLAIAVDTATFTSAYTRIGLAPDGSSTWFLPRLIGHRRAMEFFLGNRVLGAAEALDWGLVNRVVPAADLDVQVQRLAAELAHGATRAHGAVKRLLAASASESLESQMERESRAIAAMAMTADGREGVQAFVGKRAPAFGG